MNNTPSNSNYYLKKSDYYDRDWERNRRKQGRDKEFERRHRDEEDDDDDHYSKKWRKNKYDRYDDE